MQITDTAIDNVLQLARQHYDPIPYMNLITRHKHLLLCSRDIHRLNVSVCLAQW